MSSEGHCIVGFADFAAAVETSSAELVDMLKVCYAGFLGGEPSIVLRAVACGAPGEYLPTAAHGAPIEIRRGRGRIWLRSRDFDALVDLNSRVIQTWQPCALYPIDVCLKVAYTALHMEHGGVLLHGSGVVREGTAWIFCGPSGAGKSTIAELLGGTRLSDEFVSVRRDSSRFVASGTPYWMGSNVTAPIGGVFQLRQSEDVFITPRSAEEAASELFRSIEAPGADEPTEAAIKGMCRDLAASVPTGELNFRLDADEIRREISRYILCRHGDQVLS